MIKKIRNISLKCILDMPITKSENMWIDAIKYLNIQLSNVEIVDDDNIQTVYFYKKETNRNSELIRYRKHHKLLSHYSCLGYPLNKRNHLSYDNFNILLKYIITKKYNFEIEYVI